MRYTSALVLLAVLLSQAAGRRAGPLSPSEERATFRVPKGFHVELVAAEPEVIDPVALTFDAAGRLYVVEMRGYPNGGLGEGPPVLPGRVKRLEDRDGDGYFETATVFLDNLRFPTGVTPWQDGLLVADAPDLLFAADRDGDGVAEERRVLYRGFGTRNIQQLVNGLQFHLDNWIHGCNGSNDSVILDPAQPRSPAVALRGRHFRFRPERPGSLEPTSGGGQYGLAADDHGQWFTCTNSQHLRHVVLPDHYLRRNPHLAVPAVTLDVPDGVEQHTAAAKLYRISPFEEWRVERTTRRAGGADSKRFPATELVPGGYVTSACGLIVERGGLFPEAYRGNVLVCDPANNLIHRDVLEPRGPTFVARRGDAGCEFLASTDTWFRPVFLANGPDGAVYVCDFYREVIETPLSLPPDIQQRYNLQSRQRGRIWRIVPDGAPKAAPVNLTKRPAEELVKELASPNAWRRLTAQRLVIEAGQHLSGPAEAALRQLAEAGPEVPRLHALYLLDGLGQLTHATLEKALADGPEAVQVHALQLAEGRLVAVPRLQAAALKLADSPSARVRFQAAFTLGNLPPGPAVTAALAQLARQDAADPWHRAALLSGAVPHAAALLPELLRDPGSPAEFLAALANLAAVSGNPTVDALLKELAVPRPSARQLLLAEGLIQGLSRKGRLGTKAPLPEAVAALFGAAGKLARAKAEALAERRAAVRLLGLAPLPLAGPVLRDLLTPQTPAELQLAAVQALAAIPEAESADLLLAGWTAYSPAVRREAQEALFARADRLPRLLSALEQGRVPPGQIDAARRDQLLAHPRPEVRERAGKVFAALASPARMQVVAEHRKALALAGDVARGRAAFRTHCTTCHRLENVGFEVGPDLLSALKTKTPEGLLTDLLDPSREVDPRYVNYLALTKAGRVYSGLLTTETASSVVLKRAEGATDTLLRADLEELKATDQSLMPEGLEKQLSVQDLADVIAYLLAVAGR